MAALSRQAASPPRTLPLTRFSLLPQPKSILAQPPMPTVASVGGRDLTTAAPRPPYTDRVQLPTGAASRKSPPKYGHRVNFAPQTDDDFGDGGAFPEINLPQFPLGMGRRGSTTAVGGDRSLADRNRDTSLALQVDANGQVKYDAILRQGHRPDRVIQSDFAALVPLRQRTDVGELDLERPDDDTVRDTTERTRLALERITNAKIKAAQPKLAVMMAASSSVGSGSTYVRYTPADAVAGDASASQQRIIRMVQAPVDPLEPPKFKHKKIPRRPPSPPPPVMHSPPRKVTAEEQAAWVIPPCISNWKNARGYTIALDKRLAADGRGLQEPVINDKFARFSEAMFTAERHAREEIRQRALMQQKLAEKEKSTKEENLRMLAQRAREERSGLLDSVRDRAMGGESAMGGEPAARAGGRADEEEDQRVREREEIRRDRQREHERELRMSRMGAEAKAKYVARQADRDISEKIALGLAKPTVSKDSLYDQRLFTHAENTTSGFRGDDAYDVYDKPLFNHAAMSAVYRPKQSDGDDEAYGRGNAEEIDRMLGQQRFRGIGTRGDGASGVAGEGERPAGPVQFEAESDDPFGVDQFLDQAKKGKRPAEGGDDSGYGVKRTR